MVDLNELYRNIEELHKDCRNNLENFKAQSSKVSEISLKLKVPIEELMRQLKRILDALYQLQSKEDGLNDHDTTFIEAVNQWLLRYRTETTPLVQKMHWDNLARFITNETSTLQKIQLAVEEDDRKTIAQRKNKDQQKKESLEQKVHARNAKTQLIGVLENLEEDYKEEIEFMESPDPETIETINVLFTNVTDQQKYLALLKQFCEKINQILITIREAPDAEMAENLRNFIAATNEWYASYDDDERKNLNDKNVPEHLNFLEEEISKLEKIERGHSLNQPASPPAPPAAALQIPEENVLNSDYILQRINIWMEGISKRGGIAHILDIKSYQSNILKWLELLPPIQDKLNNEDVTENTILKNIYDTVENCIKHIEFIIKVHKFEQDIKNLKIKIEALKLLSDKANQIETIQAQTQDFEIILKSIKDAIDEQKTNEAPGYLEGLIALHKKTQETLEGVENEINKLANIDLPEVNKELKAISDNKKEQLKKELIEKIQSMIRDYNAINITFDEDLNTLLNMANKLDPKADDFYKKYSEILEDKKLKDRDENQIDVKKLNFFVYDLNKLKQFFKLTDRHIKNIVRDINVFEFWAINFLADAIINVPENKRSVEFENALDEMLEVIKEIQTKDLSEEERKKAFQKAFESRPILAKDVEKRLDDFNTYRAVISNEDKPNLEKANKIQMLEVFIEAQNIAIKQMRKDNQTNAIEKSEKLKKQAEDHIAYLKNSIIIGSLTKKFFSLQTILPSLAQKREEAMLELRKAFVQDNPKKIQECTKRVNDLKNDEERFKKQKTTVDKKLDACTEKEKEMVANHQHTLPDKFFAYLNGAEKQTNRSKISFNYFRNALIDLVKQGVSIGPFQGFKTLAKNPNPRKLETVNDLPETFVKMDPTLDENHLNPGTTPLQVELHAGYIHNLKATEQEIEREFHRPSPKQEQRNLTVKHRVLSLFSTKFKNKVISHAANEVTLTALKQACDTRYKELSLADLTSDQQENDPIAKKLNEWSDLVSNSKIQIELKDKLSDTTKEFLKLDPNSDNMLDFVKYHSQNKDTIENLVTELLAYCLYIASRFSADTKLLKNNPELQKKLALLNKEISLITSKGISSKSSIDFINLWIKITNDFPLNNALNDLNTASRKPPSTRQQNLTLASMRKESPKVDKLEAMKVPRMLHKHKPAPTGELAPPKTTDLYAEIELNPKVATKVYIEKTPADTEKLLSVKNALYSALALGVKLPIVITRSEYSMMVMAYKVCMVSSIPFLIPKQYTPEHHAYSEALKYLNEHYGEENYGISETKCTDLKVPLRSFTDQQATYHMPSGAVSDPFYTPQPEPSMVPRNVEYVITEHEKSKPQALSPPKNTL